MYGYVILRLIVHILIDIVLVSSDRGSGRRPNLCKERQALLYRNLSNCFDNTLHWKGRSFVSELFLS